MTDADVSTQIHLNVKIMCFATDILIMIGLPCLFHKKNEILKEMRDTCFHTNIFKTAEQRA
jgi:hypothetical protein